jgi:hypothetical protein
MCGLGKGRAHFLQLLAALLVLLGVTAALPIADGLEYGKEKSTHRDVGR